MAVLIAGYPRHDETLTALEHGPAMHLLKPITVADIEAVFRIVFKDQMAS